MDKEINNSVIALGSNLGNSLEILENAIACLAKTPGIKLKKKSTWYRTKAIGPPQPDYLNGCIILAVQMTPQLLLETLLKIEKDFGRVRNQRWGARTLDLDILLYGDRIIDTATLNVPHPRMCDRAFVLVPLNEIAPDWIEPVSGFPIKQLIKAVDCADISPLMAN
jgi:2-amino-4-hydroxy-6-hydroxymethyldihydropteridine diphosphokinase